MLGLFGKLIAAAVCLHSVAALIPPIVTEIGVEKRSGGFANSVYFTNWFVSFLFYI